MPYLLNILNIPFLWYLVNFFGNGNLYSASTLNVLLCSLDNFSKKSLVDDLCKE